MNHTLDKEMRVPTEILKMEERVRKVLADKLNEPGNKRPVNN